MSATPINLSTLAQLIASNASADNYRFYIVLAALLLICMAAGAVVSSFFKEQGKQIATNAAFQTTLCQLLEVTAETENVKVRIAHSDWTEKELRTLRRTKLEEMVTALFTVSRTIETYLSSAEIVGDIDRRSKEPMSIVEQINTLYFPEFANEMNALDQTYSAFQMWRREHHHAISMANREWAHAADMAKLMTAAVPFVQARYDSALAESQRLVDALKEKQQAMPAEFSPMYKPLHQAIVQLTAVAATLMAELIKPVQYNHEARCPL
ncbi:hypothetical protein [Massilia sp. TWR1-2-2]|uniref:hypothetical protein n=1 Tax=Massilia sp. TWR1-2-2 TaxID=2804584 RepID=UPI003CEF3479